MKKSRIFAAVVYFIFTFGIGVVFAMTLPGYFAAFTVSGEVVASSLEKGELLKALTLAEPIGFLREPVLAQTFGTGGGVVLYETVTEVYDRSDAEDGETSGLTHGMLYKCYTGYLYGVGDRYDVFSKESNAAALYVTTEHGEEVRLPLLDYDADGDGRKDGISTFTENGFVLLEIRAGDVPAFTKLSFADRTGARVFSAEAAAALNFESAFFDCFGDIEGYNELVAQCAAEGVTQEELADLNGQRNDYIASVKEALGQRKDCSLTAEAEEYREASREVSRRANNKAIPFVLLYFVAIYIIADFLLGTHYIIRFFKWFLFKVCRIPHKEKKGPPKDEVFGHDYYSMVTLRLDLGEVPEFGGSVEIKYTNGGEEFAFVLLKEENYTATLRMKAGTYVNPFIDIDRAYAPVDLPENLVVEGYRMETIIKIVKREGERL